MSRIDKIYKDKDNIQINLKDKISIFMNKLKRKMKKTDIDLYDTIISEKDIIQEIVAELRNTVYYEKGDIARNEVEKNYEKYIDRKEKITKMFITFITRMSVSRSNVEASVIIMIYLPIILDVINEV